MLGLFRRTCPYGMEWSAVLLALRAEGSGCRPLGRASNCSRSVRMEGIERCFSCLSDAFKPPSACPCLGNCFLARLLSEQSRMETIRSRPYGREMRALYSFELGSKTHVSPLAPSVWNGNACVCLAPRGTGVFYVACLDSGSPWHGHRAHSAPQPPYWMVLY